MGTGPYSGPFYVGSLVTLEVDFRDGDVLTDPTTITIEIMRPDGVAVTASYSGIGVVKDGVGQYRYEYSAAVEGTHEWIWIGTGTCQGVDAGEFFVHRTYGQ